MRTDAISEATLSDSELVLKFESLGDNCELGLIQRRVGVEPLGLLRFAGVPLRHLIRAMEARFAGMANPALISVQPENGEYMIKLTSYDFVYHAHVKVGEAEPAALHGQQARTIGFLIRKLIADMENPAKIMVFRQNEPLLANDLTDLRLALAAYGPAVLLWVQQARPGYPPGSVAVVDEKLMIGYVRRLALREDVPKLDLESWLAMLRKAYALQTGAASVARPASKRTHVVFGTEGNAAECTGYGWSSPENGFTWTTEDYSLLTIRNPGGAGDFWLEIDVVPFIAAPSLLTQYLSVTIAGELVDKFTLSERTKVGCTVPERLMREKETVEIVLGHPQAASPSYSWVSRK